MVALYILIPVLFGAVSALVWARRTDHRLVEYISKPFSTLLVIAIALLALGQPGVMPAYTWVIALGLLLSLGGDVSLMLRTNRWFLIGLVLFLLAHVAYSVAFSMRSGFQPADWIVALVLLAIGAAIYAYLRPGLGRMRGPVLMYLAVILFMVSRGVSTLFGSAFSPTQAWLIAAGAVLFMLSDLLLAINRFRRPFKAEAYGLYLYYAGQLLIALSTWPWR
ncbi:MAG TPA: lysoplasmalogenase [Anaerolineae bacterium]|nr:lysoplasmalogenase [Anaerolineae bacterium]